MFQKTLYSEKVTINAPKEKVWAVLCDLKKYPDWNPFTYQVDGELKMGSPLTLHVRMPIRGDRSSVEYVKCMNPEQTLSWGMTMVSSLFLVALRDQKVEAINANQCTYQTWDAFDGLLTPIVVGLFGKDMLNGFNGVAQALKEYCE